MWITIDNVSWNSDVVLGQSRKDFSTCTPCQTNYSHLPEAERSRALANTWDVINQIVNGKKD